MGNESELIKHYGDVVVGKLASFTKKIEEQINYMYAFIEREIKEGVETVTINENPSKPGTYPVTALAYLNSDHYMAIAKGEMVIKDDFEIQVARMHLGSALAMEFAWYQSDIIEGEEYYLQITKTYGDGRADRVVKIPMKDWNVSGNYYYAGIDKIAAKEMADTIYVQAFFADGTEASKLWTDSVRDYAMRNFAKTGSMAAKTLMVDMLNYGAAAQTYFKYNEGDLANNKLSAEQKAWATKSVELKNNQVKGEGYVASALQLQDYIKLNLKFNNIDSTMKAVIRFTNHYGVEKEYTIAGSEFEGGNVVTIDQLVAADFRQLVTVEVKDAAGKTVANAVESVESYLARASQGNDPLYTAVAKYTAAAYSNFH